MERQLITLTNHPDLPTVTRKAQVQSSINQYNAKSVFLDIKVFHYINGVEVNYFPDKIQLVGDNKEFVNPTTGDVVYKDVVGNYPVGSVGEYDYLWSIINTTKSYTQEQLEDFYINKRVLVLDKKLYI